MIVFINNEIKLYDPQKMQLRQKRINLVSLLLFSLSAMGDLSVTDTFVDFMDVAPLSIKASENGITG